MFGPYFWPVFLSTLIITMFLLVPFHRIIELLSFGLFFGFGLGVLIMYTGSTLLPLYKINNEIFPIQNWGLSIPLAWITTVIIYAYYLPKIVDTRLGLYGYIFLWAISSTLVYLFLKALGYWEDINWNIVYNTILSLSTHIIMAYYLYKTGYIQKYRKNHSPQDNLLEEIKNRP